MPAEVIEGLFDASGSMGGFLWPKGKYLVEVNRFEKDESREDQVMYKFWTTILEGPELDGGIDPNGKQYFFSVWLPMEDHAKYTPENYTRSVNTLKALVNATGVKVSSTNKVDFGNTVGQQMIIDVGQYTDKKSGELVNCENKFSAAD